MYSRTKDQIIEIIKKNGPTSVKTLVQKLEITQASAHRALNKLVEAGRLVKKGSAPKVFYGLAAAVKIKEGVPMKFLIGILMLALLGCTTSYENQSSKETFDLIKLGDIPEIVLGKVGAPQQKNEK